MIDELRVANLGVIEDATVEPGSGLVVVTGETGAGKTMLLGALQLLLGEAARTDSIGPHGDEATVEGRFLIGDDEHVVRRRVTTGGRSRAYLDGSLVAARELSERIGAGVELVGQHDHLLVTRPGAVRALLDSALDAEGRASREEYERAWNELDTTRAARAKLGGDRRELEREVDLLTHQADEIAAAGLAPGEQEALTARVGRLRHAEELREELAAAYRALDSATGIDETAGRLQRVEMLDPGLAALAGEASGLQALTAEVLAGLRSALESLDHEPGELAEIEDRLRTITDLERKYGDTVTEVLAFAESAAGRAAELVELLERAERLAADEQAQQKTVLAAAEALRASRVRAAKSVGRAAEGHLSELGFADPVVEISISPGEPGPAGADTVELLFASDRALTPAPARRSASGGELSRLVLSLRLAAGIEATPVIAFDEIDAGIGGATALAMGRKLKRLSAGRQVFCVTHLPQVAAFADTHVVIDRSGTSAAVRTVDGADRQAEIARMLSGLPDSIRGRDHADELLALGGA